jgi:hypothetical protein
VSAICTAHRYGPHGPFERADVMERDERAVPRYVRSTGTYGYVKLTPLVGEAAIGTVAYGGAVYGAYVVADGAGR